MISKTIISISTTLWDKIAKIPPEQYRCLAIVIYTKSEAFDPL
jgi:hypothetical protein